MNFLLVDLTYEKSTTCKHSPCVQVHILQAASYMYSHTYNIRYAIRSCLRGVVTIVKFFLIFIIMNRNLFFVIMDCCCCILVANTLPIPTLLLLSTYTTLRPKYVFLPIHFILHTVSDCKFFNHPQ